MDIPQKIRVMRKSEDLTQREFADMIGISYSALTSYEYGRNLPGLEITIKLFKHPRFSKYRDWFLFDEVAPKAGQVVPALAHIGQDEAESSRSGKKTG
ncbi:XRE family transcriptional regulator [Salmonella enterica subsp. enterica serovar Derby]|uniref:helix-turn-helix transcriptional regulator n=1 Tax=Enterobacteriaceae TaxID=543 RepID=UPI0009C184B6|nr:MULTISPECIES: helix-turn-helix transcriptional regulator [Enterobacteriaceae]EAB9166127.1 XRE family transcriptional regulator [Salmonella enterica subsp. enterica serovar Stanley]EBL9925103.1 XRE family transcriptional regulator [Salmonella enterica]EBV0103620.1 XRE family transcriptional regulator [Salmonella enterica subsp. enterica serovar Derby]MCY5066870.1 helix-turn-helix transcriptional regulator [Salmonella enterica subsp. enterica serovar 1,4,[5],12:i:-]ARD54071.1 transcriptional 